MTNPHADRYIHIIKELREDAVAYFLMSDGTADYVYNKTENTFYEAAAKMARMAQEENGQYLLEETVRNYMVERDRQSDDCSFICLSAAAQSETKTQCAAVQPEDGVRQSAEQVPSDKETQDSAEACGKENKRHTVTHLVENFDRPDSRRINAGDVAKGKQVKNKKRLLFAVACFVLILALVISLSGRKSGKKHTQPTSRPTTTAVSEKHSEESDLTDDTAGDALTETEESSAATSSLSQNSSETSSGEERMDEENEVSASSRSEEETESSKAAKEPELTDRPGN